MKDKISIQSDEQQSTPSFYPSDPKKLKARIRSYERSLRQGGTNDGYGKRYLLGPMYLLLGDIEGALRHYTWLEQTYPDDIGDPHDRLCWALAHFKAGSPQANKRLRDALFQNLYLIPHVLGMQIEPYPIWHGSNIAEIDYAEEIPTELCALWDEKAKSWAREFYESPSTQQELKEYLDLEVQLKDEPVGPARNALVEKIWAIKNPRVEGPQRLRLIQGGR